MLKELADYFDCLSSRTDEENDEFVPDGYSLEKNVAYKIVLTEDGTVKAILPNTHTVQYGKKVKEVGWDEVFPFHYSISGISAETIECRSKYLFGMEWDTSSESFAVSKNSLSAYEKNKQKNMEFLSGLTSPVAVACVRFLEKWNPREELQNPLLSSLGKSFSSAKFIIVAEGKENREAALHRDGQVKRKWEENWAKRFENEENTVTGQCAVSGKIAPIARIHNNLKGVAGGLATGVSLVCFKTSAFWSYGKKESYNSSVSREVMEKYTQAFNYLTSGLSHKRVFEDMTLLFWANTKERESPYLEEFAWALLDTEENAESAADALTKGKTADWRAALDENTPFFVLGIKPNSGRLCINFFEKNSFGKIMENVERHQEDLRLCAADKPLSVWAIVQNLKSPNAKDSASASKAQSDLCVKMLESILQNRPYPAALLETAVRRMKTDRDDKQKNFFSVNRNRIRIVKACLVRSGYYQREDFMLEANTYKTAFQCGRLFAVLEKIQTDALKDINATIKDKFLSSACTAPYLVFPQLLKLAQFHLKKLDKSANIFYEKILGEIFCSMDEFPKSLSLPKQGDFLFGYYQQKQKLYEKKMQQGENE